MSATASSTYDGRQHFWSVRYRTTAAEAQLYFLAAEMYGYSRTVTAAAVTAPFDGASLSAIAYPLSLELVTSPSIIAFRRFGHVVLPELEITPPSRIPPLFGETASIRQHSAAFSNVHGRVERTFSISWHRVSASSSSSTVFVRHGSLRPAAVQTAGVTLCRMIFLFFYRQYEVPGSMFVSRLARKNGGQVARTMFHISDNVTRR